MMVGVLSRRGLLKVVPAVWPMRAMAGIFGMDLRNATGSESPVPDLFPTQAPELAREIVSVSHFDLKRVMELVDARPALANAAWDWGFGDWETALGAASHMGNRAIAEYLIGKGGRPSLFSAAMLGQLDVVKGFVAAHPGAQRIRGPHSISLLAHAKAGGAAAREVFDYLQALGDAGSDAVIPVGESEINLISGTYVFGIGTSQKIDVTAENGQLTWTRRGMMGRPLVHLGNGEFYPAGASSARIRFAADQGEVMMTVYDPSPVLTARKQRERK